MKPWWEQDAFLGWLEYEIGLLKSLHGIQVCDVIKHEDGRATINLNYEYNGEIIAMKVIFPAQYPYFPPTIDTPGRKMHRHRGNTTEQICFLGHNTNGETGWVPLEDTAAKMLQEQVPEALRISDLARDGKLTQEAVRDKEVNVGEPLSCYLAEQHQGGIFMNDYEIPASTEGGAFSWALIELSGDIRAPLLTGVLENPVEHSRAKLRFSPTNWSPSSGANRKKANWIKVSPPESLTTQELWGWFEVTHPQLAGQVKNTATHDEGHVGLVGLVMEEEITHQKIGVSWIFLASIFVRGQLINVVLPALRISEREMTLRVPELSPLRNKSALIIGLGSIGAPVALQLAKSGIANMHLIDRDVVKPGNIVRWPLGMSAVGKHKALYLSKYISDNYPGVKTKAEHMAIGDPLTTLSQIIKLQKLIKDADIVIDGTASIEVNGYLANLCEKLESTYMWLSTTEGAWGGIVGRLTHMKNHGCSMEYWRRLSSGEIEIPTSKLNDSVVPAGCVTSTFTGIGVDCEQVGVFAARLAISTLCGGEEGYPDFDWDVGVFDFRNQEGTQAIIPTWKTYSLSCPQVCGYRGKYKNCDGN